MSKKIKSETRGRPNKPTALRLLENRRAKMNENEPAPNEVDITPPPGISVGAKKIWEYYAHRLKRLGLLTELDLDSLELLCEAISEMKLLEVHCRSQPYVIQSLSGNMVSNPVYRNLYKARQQVATYSRNFGLNPSARAGLEVAPGTSKQSTYKALMEKKKGLKNGTK